MWQMKNRQEEFEGAGGSGTTEAGMPVLQLQPAAEWVRSKLGFAPDDTQARLLSTQSKRVLLNCTRQWGKSTTTAAKAVHHAYTQPETLTLVVSPSARQVRLQYFDFASGKSTTVARRLGEIGYGLTASPDGRTILYTRVDSSVDDLMLVENFR